MSCLGDDEAAETSTLAGLAVRPAEVQARIRQIPARALVASLPQSMKRLAATVAKRIAHGARIPPALSKVPNRPDH